MEKLRNIIENTLCVNLEINDETKAIDFPSVQTCSDYISKEIQDMMMDYTQWLRQDQIASGCLNYKIVTESGRAVSEETLVNQFINERYKEQP